jgi:hypothetical protein
MLNTSGHNKHMNKRECSFYEDVERARWYSYTAVVPH